MQTLNKENIQWKNGNQPINAVHTCLDFLSMTFCGGSSRTQFLAVVLAQLTDWAEDPL